MTAEVWSQVGPGWTLTYWEPSRARHGEAPSSGDDPNVAAFYVQSPTGDRYEAGHFPVSGDNYRSQIASWVPGSFKAIILDMDPDEGAEAWAWIDLRDGSTQPVEAIGDALFQGTNSDGDMVFGTLDRMFVVGPDGVTKATLDPDHWDLSPDGTALMGVTVTNGDEQTAMSVISATTGEPAWTFDMAEINKGDPSLCKAEGWAGPAEPAVICQGFTGADDDYAAGPATIYAVGADGAQEVFSDGGGTVWYRVSLAADGVVATGGPANSDGEEVTFYIDRSPIEEWPAQDGHAQLPGIRTVAGTEYALSLTGSDSVPAYMNARVVGSGKTFAVKPDLSDDPDWWYPTQSATYLVGGTGSFN